MNSMEDWAKEDLLKYRADYDRPRNRSEILENRRKFAEAEKILQLLERFDSENYHWYERIGEEQNGKFEKLPSELTDYNGARLNFIEQRQIRHERKALLKIRELIGFHDYHSDASQETLILLYKIYRRFGLKISVIAQLMDKKVSYFRSMIFNQIKIDKGIKYDSNTLIVLNKRLHENFDRK